MVYNNNYKSRRNLRFSERRRTDPNFKLRQYLSNYIKYHLLKNKSSKNGNSMLNYLPYTMDKLKIHLESLFETWMTWNNHGMYNTKTWNDNDQSTWNIDHIIPQSDLPYTSMKDDNFKKCWALENLRPLSVKQNIIDKNRKNK
jgi:hypothetical protein